MKEHISTNPNLVSSVLVSSFLTCNTINIKENAFVYLEKELEKESSFQSFAHIQLINIWIF
jgi:hypothetical protein